MPIDYTKPITNKLITIPAVNATQNDKKWTNEDLNYELIVFCHNILYLFIIYFLH